MMKKLILITLLLGSMMQALLAVTLTTNKATYTSNEQVHVHFANMTAKNKDWIAIYPQGSNNDWANVVGWKWTDDKANGDLIFGNGDLPVGSYEVRAFYNNSFHTEATKRFEVAEAGNHANLTTNKATYAPNEQVHVHFENMTAKNKDWIAIYPQGSNNDWANVVGWKWTDDKANGDLIFGNGDLPVGSYEVRAFYNNSFNVEASTKFKVEDAGNNANINTNKAVYGVNEQIHVNFANMTGQNKDWIGIYPEGSNNDWDNVVAWKWTNDTANGNIDFAALPVGAYEVRAFYNNSFNLEATKGFKVQGVGHNVNVNTNKNVYAANENIIVTFANMTAKNQDWIGIYPENANNDFNNVVAWKWTNDTANGNLDFGALPVGSYEVRAFYNNSLNVETTAKFKVEGAGNNINVNTNKAVYDVGEQIRVNFANMTAKNQDWIGIYPENANNDFNNVVAWKWTNDTENGNLDFAALPVGSYEVRAFYNNSLNVEATTRFKVQDDGNGNVGPDHVLYDDMENGLDARWVKYAGNAPAQIINKGAQGSAHSIRVRARSGFYFDFGNPAKKLKFLELDLRIGVASHIGNFGVVVKTKKGNRRIIFSSYMNHPGNHFGVPPEKWDKPFLSANGYQHNHPGPTDYFLDTRNGKFIHYKINIDEKIKILEPDNEVLSILLFTTAGGDYDNLALSSN